MQDDVRHSYEYPDLGLGPKELMLKERMNTTVHRYQLEVAKRLKLARGQAGLTQERLAKRLGRPQSFISKLETAERSPSFVEVVLICAELHIDPMVIVPHALRKTP